jgi:hypothetical protein
VSGLLLTLPDADVLLPFPPPLLSFLPTRTTVVGLTIARIPAVRRKAAAKKKKKKKEGYLRYPNRAKSGPSILRRPFCTSS